MYERSMVKTLLERMKETDNPFIQILVGPRQTGKSTMITQALAKLALPAHSVSADDELAPNVEWLKQEWQQARNLEAASHEPVVLVIDEVQKVRGWENVVKGLWDADRKKSRKLKVVLSGSSSLLIRHGLADSLMGRFELIYSPQWSFGECREAFGYTLEDFLYFGGYPGAARLTGNERRWRAYVEQSIIAPTIDQDVLQLENVRKPALLRALFTLGVRYSAQELSYAKMLGQLQDSGNTATIAHYLELLGNAGILSAIPKYDPKLLARRKSSPRLMVHDTALMTAPAHTSKAAFLSDLERKGHLVESACGAYLIARSKEEGFTLSWWREGNREVDFVAFDDQTLWGIEVKSGRMKSLAGMSAFLTAYPKARRLVVGGSDPHACTLKDFLLGNVELF